MTDTAPPHPWAPRTLWYSAELDKLSKEAQDPETYDEHTEEDRHQVATEAEANLVASWVEEGVHWPVLDIDYPARLVPSSTPGHFHLYLDKAVAWEDYELVLAALAQAGLIEPGYLRASQRREMTFARVRPTKPKPPTCGYERASPATPCPEPATCSDGRCRAHTTDDLEPF